MNHNEINTLALTSIKFTPFAVLVPMNFCKLFQFVNMKTLLRILLVLLLLLGAKRSVFAQSKDSVVIKGCLIANDSSDLARLGEFFLSVSQKKFQVVYRNKFAHTESPFQISEEFITNTDGCFEVKLPKSIYMSNVFFRFPEGKFKDCYAILRERDNKVRQQFNLKSEITIVQGPISDCIFHMREDREPFYDEGFLKKGGIESILKSIH